jgi:hypothetical protein
MSYTVERIAIHHVATPHSASDVENVLPMVRHYQQGLSIGKFPSQRKVFPISNKQVLKKLLRKEKRY